MRRLHEQSGIVGKIMVIWLIVVAVLGVVAFDAISIGLTTLRLSNAASAAASTGASTYRSSKSAGRACDVAAQTVEEEDPGIATPKRGFCKVDQASGEVTITLKTDANTIVAGRLSFTEDLAAITVTETGRPSTL